jgi:hypothetical protein
MTLHDHGITNPDLVEMLIACIVRTSAVNNMCGCYALAAAVAIIERCAKSLDLTFDEAVQDGRDIMAEAQASKETGVN